MQNATAITDAFDLAIKRLSLTQLKKLSERFGKSGQSKLQKPEYVAHLNTIFTPAQKQTALRTGLLAGVGSVSYIALPEHTDLGDAMLSVPTRRRVSRVPSVVVHDLNRAIFDDRVYLGWGHLVPDKVHLNADLELDVQENATISDSYIFDAEKIMEIRGAAAVCSRITKTLGGMLNVDPAIMSPIGLSSTQQVESFKTLIGGTILGCKGDQREVTGFGAMTGKRHPDVDDLYGTVAYDRFKQENEMAAQEIEFTFAGARHAVLFGLITQSLMFRTHADEATHDFVRKQLLAFKASSN